MKKSEIFALLLGAVLLSSCGNSASTEIDSETNTTTSAATVETVPETTTTAETTTTTTTAKTLTPVSDIVDCYFDNNAGSCMGMTLDEINEVTNNQFDLNKAYNVNEKYGYYTYYCGEKEKIFSDRIDLGGKFPVYVELSFEDSKLDCIKYEIGDMDVNGNQNPEETFYKIFEQIENLATSYKLFSNKYTGANFQNDENGYLINPYVALNMDKNGEILPIYPVCVKFKVTEP